MRALTVQQPWAWAIVHGGKDVENRTQVWSYRGPLAIHAGMRWSVRGGGTVPQLLDSEPARAAYDRLFELGGGPGGASGAIIGVVELVDVHPAQPVAHGSASVACCESWWAESQYDEHHGRRRRDIVHLVLERPRALAEPVLCRGALGLWTVPVDVMIQVVNQFGEAPGELL